jgi:hypothetical protein
MTSHESRNESNEDRAMVNGVDTFLAKTQAGRLMSDEELADEVRRGADHIVERWIASLKWSPQATEHDKALVGGNLRSFWHWLHVNSRGRVAASVSEKAEPTDVWEVANKTTSCLFATEEAADQYIASFPTSVGGGMQKYQRHIIKALRRTP